MPERHRGQGCGRNRGMAPMRGGIRFLQTCLLVLLNQKKSYGYSLANELAQFGFSPGHSISALSIGHCVGSRSKDSCQLRRMKGVWALSEGYMK